MGLPARESVGHQEC